MDAPKAAQRGDGFPNERFASRHGVESSWRRRSPIERVPAMFAIDLIRLSPRCPFRSADWRWRAANLLARPGCRSRRRWIDEPVRRAARFLRRAARLGGLGHPRLERLDPDLAAALALHADLNHRLAIEARVLAGVASELIAERCSVATGVVALYEAMFYDVRHGMECTDWVMFRAIDPSGALWGGTPSNETIVRLLAYRGGPLVAEAALRVFGGVAGASEVDPDAACRLRLVADLMRLPIASKTAPLLMRTYLLRVEIERRLAARTVTSITGPVITDDFCAKDASTWSFLDKEVRANGTPDCPTGAATLPAETLPPSGAASDSLSALPELARRTA